MSPALTPGSAARPWSWGSVIVPGGQRDAGGLLCSTFPKEKIGRCSLSTVPPRSSFPGPVGNGEEGAWHGMLLPCGAALGSPTRSAVPAGAVGSPGGDAGPCSQLFLVVCFWDLPSPFHRPFSTPWPAVSSLFCWIPVETVKNSAACSGKGIYLNAARQTPSFYLFWIWAFHLLISVFSTGRDKTGHFPVAFPFHFAFHRHLSYSPFLVLVPLCGSCSVPLPAFVLFCQVCELLLEKDGPDCIVWWEYRQGFTQWQCKCRAASTGGCTCTHTHILVVGRTGNSKFD